MTEKEFLIKCRELIGTARRGHEKCCDIQAGLNEDFRDRRITYEEWRIRTEENEERRAFFTRQLEWLGEGLEGLKKY